MASIIDGYTYDIFISYRQKDNKGDKWVSEFVEALKTELESTFKEEISVYFDINPHDGLLETHNVDKSLEGKLKCLVFIPVISQTYCDPKSFAWQHEFCAFNKLAKEDQFGRDIRLSGGNIASRILPIKINDLDPEDKTLLENELGGVLRAVEFIYKEPGVNRPLTPGDDEKLNLNRTKYRNQINKVANAVKEIITTIKKHNQQNEEVSRQVDKAQPERPKTLKAKFLVVPFLVMVLIVLGYFFIPKLFKSSEPVEKSIAVLPFENLSSDEEQLWFSDGITDVIINQLSKISDLRVLGRTSTLKYRKEQKSISEIGAELGVNFIIEGTVQRQENKMRISVQLIRVINEGHIWSDLYDREWKDIFDVQSDIAQRIAEELKTVLTPEEKELIENSQTKNPGAYNLYLKGRFFWNKRTEEGFKKSVEYFEKSIAEDPDYALAYAGLADSYFLIAWYGWYSQVEGYARAKKFALRALEIDKNLAEAHATLGSLISWSEWKWEEARKELLLAIKLNPNYIMAHSYYSELLDIFRQNDEARKQINFALELDPFFPVIHGLSGLLYYNEGKFEESLDEYRKVQELDPDNIGVYWRYFKLYLMQGENLKAIEALQKIMLMDTSTVRNVTVVKDVYNKSGVNGLLNWLIELQLKNPQTSPISLATWYAMVNKKEEALDWLEKGMEERSPSIPRINNDPAFDNLRSEPRFLAIIKKLGLSD